MLKKILKNPQAVAGLLLIFIIVFAALAAPLIAPHSPDAVNPADKFLPASAQYPLGTDQLGRCEFSRLLYGARYSLGMALPIVLGLSAAGLLIGSLSVCVGDKLNKIITYLTDVFMSFPSLIIAIAVISILGNGTQNIAVAVIISMWAWFARMVRSYCQIEMGKDYILAAKISGCGKFKLIFRHLLPNIMPQFMVYISTSVASAILTVSSFSFLGLGLPLGTAEWGAMLNEARSCLYSHSELLIYPGICILITTAGFNLFGEALRDILSREDSGV